MQSLAFLLLSAAAKTGAQYWLECEEGDPAQGTAVASGCAMCGSAEVQPHHGSAYEYRFCAGTEFCTDLHLLSLKLVYAVGNVRCCCDEHRCNRDSYAMTECARSRPYPPQLSPADGPQPEHYGPYPMIHGAGIGASSGSGTVPSSTSGSGSGSGAASPSPSPPPAANSPAITTTAAKTTDDGERPVVAAFLLTALPAFLLL